MCKEKILEVAGCKVKLTYGKRGKRKRHFVGKHASILHELKPSDFDPSVRNLVQNFFLGSKGTLHHQSVEFHWKDYYPMVCRRLKKLFQADPADYMLATSGNDAFKESEVKVLITMLPSSYEHILGRKLQASKGRDIKRLKLKHGEEKLVTTCGSCFQPAVSDQND